MDELQSRLVQLGLERLAEHGFALAGGQALQAHGLVERWSEDIDLFTDRWDPGEFGGAVETVADAYRQAGLAVVILRRAETFARLEASDPATGQSSMVDLAADRRGHQPVAMTLGPVLSESDAVATKVAAVFSRGAARDYIDLAGILSSGHYGREDLMALAETVDGGFTPRLFAESLADVDRIPEEAFTRYGVDREHVAAVRRVMRDWSHQLLETLPPPEDRRRVHETDLLHSQGRTVPPEQTPPGREGPGIDL